MKKKFLSQLMILSFAVAGLFLVENNVLAGDPTVIIDESDHEGGGYSCPGGSCTYTDHNFNTSCSACCASSDRPICNSWGCECEER